MKGDPHDPPRPDPIRSTNEAEKALRCVLENLVRNRCLVPLRHNSKLPLCQWKRFEALCRRHLEGKDVEKEYLALWRECVKDGKPVNYGLLVGLGDPKLVVIDFDDPSLAEAFFERLKEVNEPLYSELVTTMQVRTRRGFHLYLAVEGEAGSEKLSGVDVKASGYVVYPPSVVEGVKYEVVSGVDAPVVLDEPSWEAVIEVLREVARKKAATGKRRAPSDSFRHLSKEEKQRLVDALTREWSEGARHSLALAFAGALAKKGVHPRDVAEIVWRVALAKDDEELADRLTAVYSTYRCVCGDCAEEVSAFADEKGIRVWSDSRSNCEVVGTSWLRENAPEVARAIGALFGSRLLVPHEAVDGRATSYFVADLDRGETLFCSKKRGEERCVYIMDCALERVVFYRSEYAVVWVKKSNGEWQHIFFSGRWSDLADELDKLQCVRKKEKTREFLGAVHSEAFRRKITRYSSDWPPPPKGGFYVEGGEVKAVWLRLESPSEEGLRESLTFIEEMAEYYKPEVLGTVLQWATVAPFAYVRKTVLRAGSKPFPWLILVGPGGTGKSTLAGIVTEGMWGKILQSDISLFEGSGSARTEPRVAELVSETTLPRVVDEAREVFENRAVLDIVKASITGIVIKRRADTGKKFIAFGTLIFTANEVPPLADEEFRRRFVVAHFDEEMVEVVKKRRREFSEGVLTPVFVEGKLVPFAQKVAEVVMGDANLLALDWREMAVEVIKRVYASVGMEPPEWLVKEYTSYDPRESVVAGFVKVLKERLSKVNQKLLEEARWRVSAEEKVNELLHAKALIIAGIMQGVWPWAALVEGEGGRKVVFKNIGIVNDLRNTGFNVTHFRTLGQALEEEVEGCQYRRILEKVGRKTRRPWVIECDLDSLARLLFGSD